MNISVERHRALRQARHAADAMAAGAAAAYHGTHADQQAGHGKSGTFEDPGVPYLQAIGLEKDDLVQALGLSFTVSPPVRWPATWRMPGMFSLGQSPAASLDAPSCRRSAAWSSASSRAGCCASGPFVWRFYLGQLALGAYLPAAGQSVLSCLQSIGLPRHQPRQPDSFATGKGAADQPVFLAPAPPALANISAVMLSYQPMLSW